MIINNILDHTDPDIEKIIKDCYVKSHKEMLGHCIKTKEFDVALSGTTVTIVILDKKNMKLYISHVGDSRAIVIYKENETNIVGKEITRDHKPTDPDEKQRIKK
jgi:serine/threonine protein phosphatase PrpC